jgi:TonB family protein
MTPALVFLFALSVKIALVGAIVWMQLYFLRRAPAQLRSRLCVAALALIPLLAAVQLLMSNWLRAVAVDVPLVVFKGNAAATGGASSSHWGNWILWCWIAGVAVMTARAIAGRMSLAALRRNSIPVSDVGALDVRIANVYTPVLAGLARPVILVPAAYSEWTAAERGMVLRHEQNHFQQRDHWAILLAQMVRAMLWFHPVAWMLAARLSREQELACDEAVIAAGHAPHAYAAFLLDGIRALNSPDLFSCAMAGSGAESVKQRFARLLDPRPRSLRRGWLAASLTALTALVVAATVVTPVWSQSEKKEDGRVYKVGDDVLPPKVLYKVDPKYTQEARDAGIQGTVLLKVVVTSEGKADRIEVVKGLDPGLDQSAIDAISQWVFQPGTKAGKSVDVAATIEVSFRLEKDR